jgi:hypothetical protein
MYNHTEGIECKEAKYTKKKQHSPITSYGVILFTMVNLVPHFLLYQRRDSYEYMDFMRGMWSNDRNEAQLKSLFSLMTKEERIRLVNFDFDMLWKDLWTDHTCHIFTAGCERARKKFESIKSQIPRLILETEGNYSEPPWAFTKGKRNEDKMESNLDCALRELVEETKIVASKDELKVWEVPPFTEHYKGSNDKTYATQYFLVECANMFPIQKIQTPQCIRKETLSEEAMDARWVVSEEACTMINARRSTMLSRVTQLIFKRYEELSPFSTQ